MKLLQKIGTILFFIFIYCIFLFTLKGMPGSPIPNITKNIDYDAPPFDSSLERGRYAQILSIAYDKKFTVDKYYHFLKPDLAWYSGHYYSAFPPGTALLATPFFLLGNYIGYGLLFAYGVFPVITLLTAIVLYVVCKKVDLSYRTALFTVFIYTLCSMVWVYSVTISAHPLTALSLIFAFYLYLSINKQNKHNFFLFSLLWIAYGINFFIDYPALLFLFPIVIGATLKLLYLTKTQKKIHYIISLIPLYSSIFFFIIISAFVYFNLANYNKVFVFTNTYNLKALEKLGIQVDEKSLSNDLFAKKNYSNRFSLNKTFQGSALLLFSQDRGLFFYFPIFLLSIIGFYFIRYKQFVIVLSSTILLNLALYASFDDPWGGWSFGPRYMIASLPLLALVSGFAFDKLTQNIRSILGKILVFILAIYSSSVALVGAITLNIVPPAVEAAQLKLRANYLFNVEMLQKGDVNTFVYKYIIHDAIKPFEYFVIVESFVIIVLFIIIFFPNLKTKR